MKEIQEIINKSQRVIDTNMSIQADPTNTKVNMGIVSKQKIITTNRYISKMPFYNPDFTQIIDHRNPIINTDFINRQTKYKFKECLKKKSGLTTGLRN